MRGQHLETTPVVVKPCNRCGALLLSGVAEGIHAYVDIAPIDRGTEVAAVRAGRWTYTLTRAGLVYRDALRMTDPVLASPVLAEHACPRKVGVR